jgi:uridine kinase
LLGDQIQIRTDYFATSVSLCDKLRTQSHWNASKMVVGIAGESGSGKSVTAVCLQKTLADFGRRALIVHQDDYFILPPASNHAKRQEDFSWIGPNEVRLDLIAYTVDQFMANATSIEVPLVHYQANEILSEVVQLSGYDLLIIEGTYSLMLPKLEPVSRDCNAGEKSKRRLSKQCSKLNIRSFVSNGRMHMRSWTKIMKS